MKLNPVAKAVVAAVGVLATIAGGVVADNVVDASESTELLTQLVLAALTVYGVYKKANKPTDTRPPIEQEAAEQ